jgi:hypothetical protein
VLLFSRSYRFSFKLNVKRVRFAPVFVASRVPVRRAVVVFVASVFPLLSGAPLLSPEAGGFLCEISRVAAYSGDAYRVRFNCGVSSKSRSPFADIARVTE